MALDFVAPSQRATGGDPVTGTGRARMRSRQAIGYGVDLDATSLAPYAGGFHAWYLLPGSAGS